MTIALLVLAVLTVILLARLLSGREGKNSENSAEGGTGPGTDDDFDNPLSDMENLYFEKVRTEGLAQYRLASIYDQFDIMFVKSLFQSEQIPFYMQFENLNNLMPGFAIDSLNNVVLNVLDEDYADAVEVLEEYIRTRTCDCLYEEDEGADQFDMEPEAENTIEIYYKQ